MLWHILFQNAREFNIEGSQIYNDVLFLQGLLDKTLAEQAELHSVPGVNPEQLQSLVKRARSGMNSEAVQERESNSTNAHLGSKLRVASYLLIPPHGFITHTRHLHPTKISCVCHR